MPKGKKLTAIRADSAAYQAAIFNWCEETGKVFAIGADQDVAVKAAIKAISECEWKTFRDGEIAETVHCMNKTDKAFRLIVVRRPCEQDLFEEKSHYRYHAIASNRENEDAATTMEWYCKRRDAILADSGIMLLKILKDRDEFGGICGQSSGRKADGQEPTDALVAEGRSSHAAGQSRHDQWQPAATASRAARYPGIGRSGDPSTSTTAAPDNLLPTKPTDAHRQIA